MAIRPQGIGRVRRRALIALRRVTRSVQPFSGVAGGSACSDVGVDSDHAFNEASREPFLFRLAEDRPLQESDQATCRTQILRSQAEK